MFFDIHTHGNKPDNNVDKIINILPNFSNIKRMHSDLKYSIGIHPCYIPEKNLKQELETIRTFAKIRNISAIGEIGLDRLSNSTREIQIDTFLEQLKTAEEFDKPVIIHCVRCYSELLNIRKKFSKQKWIIHGFRGKPELAQQLLEKNMYLSFGEAVISPTHSLQKTIRKTPLEHIFIETDESKLSIEEIYKKVSEIKGINIDSLTNAVKLNWEKIFKN